MQYRNPLLWHLLLIQTLVLSRMDGGHGEALLDDVPQLEKGELLYANTFSSERNVQDWVMEGPGKVECRRGWMHMYSPAEKNHHVFWCPKNFPDRFIAEWEAQNQETDKGLCIIFFAATGLNGEDIFDPSLPKRDGQFSWYIKDRLNSYHISYYANTPKKPGRNHTNLRKNHGFRLVQEGGVGIPAKSTAIHRLRLVKDGPHVLLYVDQRKVIDWLDNLQNEPRPYYKTGKIGLRQMRWTHFRYRNFKVWNIKDKPEPTEVLAPISVIHPKSRLWPQPSMGMVAKKNPPSLQWPRVRGTESLYDVRLSQDPVFSFGKQYQGESIPWLIFNPHDCLAPGDWYWQYRRKRDPWSKVQHFQITQDSQRWEPPSAGQLIAALPHDHPRVLVDRSDIDSFRARAAGTREAIRIMAAAKSHLDQQPPHESSGRANFHGQSKAQNGKIAKDASKHLGDQVFQAVDMLCKAYVLTGETRYARQAIDWAMEVSTWDPDGVSRINDFGDSRCMLSMALVYDTMHNILDTTEQSQLLAAIQARAGNFFLSYRNNKETLVLSNHVWQHIFHYLFDTALAVQGDLPAADSWLAYLYEMFLARAPILGDADGGWVNGLSYFRMNMATLIDVPQVLKKRTGFDFFHHTPWYAENTYYLLYGFPPGSAGTGFGDNAHDLPEPRGAYLAYADALSRIMKNSYAAWYRDRIVGTTRNLEPHVQAYMRTNRVSSESVDICLGNTDTLQWYRLKYLYGLPAAKPKSPKNLPKARVFRGSGLVTMHSQSLADAASGNLMLAMRSSPYGTYSHQLADNNTFNIVYGGDRLFYHTGYKVAMKARHRLEYYKHTRSHNGILVDGKGQPYSTEAYGWIEHFLTGEHLSYAAGNASHAYHSSQKRQDAGLKLFRRHVLMLRPDILVIYDELEADHPAAWSWLLHCYQPMKADHDTHRITAANKSGRAIVHLYSSSETDWRLTDKYAVPAENWRQIRDEQGKLITYPNNACHFSANSQKCKRIRYLAILQVRPNGQTRDYDFNKIIRMDSNHLRIGKWKITAVLDPDKEAKLSTCNPFDRVAFTYGDESLALAGRRFSGQSAHSAKLAEWQDGKWVLQEGIPEIPAAAEINLRASQE